MTHIDPLGDVDHRVPADVLRLQAESIGDRTFLIDDRGPLSYGEVDELADRHAAAYADLGIGKGDTVAFLMENSTTLASTVFGVNRLGAAWSPVSTEYRGEWLRELLSAIGSRVLVVDRHLLPEVLRCGELPFEHIVINGADRDEGASQSDQTPATLHDLSDFSSLEPYRNNISLNAGETSAVLWTSGTTGRSKGVMQPHATWTLWAQRHNNVFRGGIRSGESFYYCMPMYNSGGWIMNVMPALITGTQAAIDKRFSVSEFWNRIRHFGANHTMTLGTMHVYLYQQPERSDDADNPLRSLVMNPVIPQLMRPFMDRFGVERIASGFGQSEIMGATLYTSDLPLKIGSCGYTVDDDLVETRLLDDTDEAVGVDQVGEICVRPRVANAIFSGYLGQPKETLEAFRNLWHHTGDLGRRDADGEIFFVDRKKDSLRHKGRNTSTFEVEHIARQFPGVANAAAVGVAVEEIEHEEELMIVLLRQEGAHVDPPEFCKFLDERAPYFFVPRYVEVVDELPMTPTNKIQKFVLRDRGVGPTTWDRTVSAADWEPTRPAGSPRRSVTNEPAAL